MQSEKEKLVKKNEVLEKALRIISDVKVLNKETLLLCVTLAKSTLEKVSKNNE